MFARFVTRITCALLRGASLSIQDRTLLTVVLLDKLGFIPASDIIEIDETNGIKIAGKKISVEQAIVLRESARKVLAEPAWKVVHDQITFEAVKIGVHRGESPEQVYFSKVALWWKLQEMKLFKAFGQQEESIDFDEL